MRRLTRCIIPLSFTPSHRNTAKSEEKNQWSFDAHIHTDSSGSHRFRAKGQYTCRPKGIPPTCLRRLLASAQTDSWKWGGNDDPHLLPRSHLFRTVYEEFKRHLKVTSKARRLIEVLHTPFICLTDPVTITISLRRTFKRLSPIYQIPILALYPSYPPFHLHCLTLPL
jgi:hypothetical protein